MSKEYLQSLCRGSGDSMYTRGKRTQHVKPDSVVGRGDQPEAGDGHTGRYGVAERPIVPVKPGNAGGGKGPCFKTGAESGKAREIGATPGNSCNVCQRCGRYYMLKRRKNPDCEPGSE